jgi:hypothetical protein
MGQDHGEDMFAIGVHGAAFLFSPGRRAGSPVANTEGYFPAVNRKIE